jgi:hypothetical protein
MNLPEHLSTKIHFLALTFRGSVDVTMFATA